MRLVWVLDAGLPAPKCNMPVLDLHGNLIGVEQRRWIGYLKKGPRVAVVSERDHVMSRVLGPLQSTRHRIPHAIGIERFEHGSRRKRCEIAAPAREDFLR